MTPEQPTPHCYRLRYYTFGLEPEPVDVWAWSAEDALKQGPSVLRHVMRNRSDYVGWHSVDVKPWIRLRDLKAIA